MPVWIGTSGWHYAHWRDGLYPRGLATSRWLSHYAERFATVELNNAFYRLPAASAFEQWATQLPDGFVVAVKASRYLTHVRRLRDPKDPVRRLLQQAKGLGSKLGPFLLQLPPNLRVDMDALRSTLDAFGSGVRVAVEVRHASWLCDELRGVLAARDAALCVADGGALDTPWWRTASWGYVRFHRGRAQPESCYGRAALASRASRIAGVWTESDDVFVYFNNDGHGCAPRDARVFAAAVEKSGLRPTRVPPARETALT